MKTVFKDMSRVIAEFDNDNTLYNSLQKNDTVTVDGVLFVVTGRHLDISNNAITVVMDIECRDIRENWRRGRELADKALSRLILLVHKDKQKCSLKLDSPQHSFPCS